MSRSAWFSHVRLWICLALLLATNLANVIDGLILADVAKCVCEEAGLNENGIQFLLQGERIGSVRLIEDDFVAIDVRQAAIPPESVNWEVSGSFKEAESVSLQPPTGESTVLEIETTSFVESNTERQIWVGFTENGDSPQRYEANLKVDLQAAKVVRIDSVSPVLMLRAFPGFPVQTGRLVFEVRNSSLSDWRLAVAEPFGTVRERGSLKVSGRTIGANRFEVDFEFDPEKFGRGLVANSRRRISNCGGLGLIVDSPSYSLRGGVRIRVANQFDLGCID